jgi:Restriction endonuclease
MSHAMSSPDEQASVDVAQELVALQRARTDTVCPPATPRGLAELSQRDAALLLGAAGSGKSTLLRAMAGTELAIHVDVFDLAGTGTLVARLEEWATQKMGLDAPVGAVGEALAAGTLRLLLDGIDELSRLHQVIISRELIEALRRGAIRLLTVSSRATPTTASLARHIEVIACPKLTPSEVESLLLNCSRGRPRSPADLADIVRISDGNALIARLLCSQIQATQRLAQNRVDVLKGAVDRALGAESRSSGEDASHGQALHACSQLALDLLLSNYPEAETQHVVEVLSPHLSQDMIKEAFSPDQALFHRSADGTVRFRHRLVAEFLAALVLRDEPNQLAIVADLGSAPDAVCFALDMSLDPVASLVALGKRLGTDELTRLAARTSRTTSRDWKHARAVLVQQLRDSLDSAPSAETAEWLPDDQATYPEPWEETAGKWPYYLLDAWRDLGLDAPDPHIKGRRLERFSDAFFGTVFTVKKGVRTKVSQIDLILETDQAGAFWVAWGATIPVECKNRDDKVGAPLILKFLGDPYLAQKRLAFYVSRTGFTKDAEDAIRATSQRPGLLLVPIRGAHIATALEHGEAPAPFFRELVRDAEYGRYS